MASIVEFNGQPDSNIGRSELLGYAAYIRDFLLLTLALICAPFVGLAAGRHVSRASAGWLTAWRALLIAIWLVVLDAVLLIEQPFSIGDGSISGPTFAQEHGPALYVAALGILIAGLGVGVVWWRLTSARTSLP